MRKHWLEIYCVSADFVRGYLRKIAVDSNALSCGELLVPYETFFVGNICKNIYEILQKKSKYRKNICKIKKKYLRNIAKIFVKYHKNICNILQDCFTIGETGVSWSFFGLMPRSRLVFTCITLLFFSFGHLIVGYFILVVLLCVIIYLCWKKLILKIFC